MQSLLTVETPEGMHARGWLHRAPGNPDTCVVILHGHNANGSRSRFITIAKWLEHHGYDAVRWDCVRPALKERSFAVVPISDEIAQVRALLVRLRPQYRRLVLLGHSQGGLVALHLAAEGRCDALVQLMPVVDTRENVRSKFEHIGLDVEELRRRGTTTTTLPNGDSFTYDQAFFDDLLTFDAKALYRAYAKPLLVIGAERDVAIPLAEVEDGFSWANEPKELLVIDDVHNFSDENATKLAASVNAWLGRR